MRTKGLGTDESTRYVVVFDIGDEVLAGLRRFATDEGLSAASFTAIGALQEATLGYFDLGARTYREIPIDQQVEVLTLAGNVGRGQNDQPAVHAHAVLGLADGTTRGGHVLRGVVRPTLEVVITESAPWLRRSWNEDVGLALLEP